MGHQATVGLWKTAIFTAFGRYAVGYNFVYDSASKN